MVNVAGRSKGCSTCRKRRVKCDENSPICDRCRRLGLDCDGPKATTFILTTQDQSCLRRMQKLSVCSKEFVSKDLTTLGLTLPKQPSLEFMNDELYQCYARRYFARGAGVDLALEKLRICQRSESDGNLPVRNFQGAFSSFATIVYGIDHGHQSICQKGYALHGEVLLKLNQALSNPLYQTSDEVILTVVVLALLESLVPTDSGSYLNHMLALEKLLALRDPPSSYTSPQSLNIYRSMRHMLIFASLRTKKATILAKPAWRSVLRLSCGEEGSCDQDLFEILASCSVLQEQIAGLHSAHNRADQSSNMSQGISTLLLDLDKWWTRYCPTLLKSFPPTIVQQLYPVFTSQNAALAFVLYYTAAIWVFRSIRGLMLAESWTNSEPTMYISEALQMVMYDITACHKAEKAAANALCCCMPGYLAIETKWQLSSSPIVHWGLTTAWETLEIDASAGYSMIKDMVGPNSGLTIAKGVLLT